MFSNRIPKGLFSRNSGMIPDELRLAAYGGVFSVDRHFSPIERHFPAENSFE